MMANHRRYQAFECRQVLLGWTCRKPRVCLCAGVYQKAMRSWGWCAGVMSSREGLSSLWFSNGLPFVFHTHVYIYMCTYDSYAKHMYAAYKATKASSKIALPVFREAGFEHLSSFLRADKKLEMLASTRQ